MAITPNYDPNGLAPKILINDLIGGLRFTYEAAQIAATPTQDFQLRALNLHLGINDDYGSLSFLIDDPNNNLTDTTLRRGSTIKRQWTVQLSLGKSSADLNRWFYGKIMDVEVLRPNTNMQKVRVLCAGWAIRLKDRVTNIRRFQKKTSDGITLDGTDTAVRVSELAKDIVNDIDHFPHQGLAVESEITETGVATIDIKLADFQQNFQTFSAAMSQLAAAGGAIYGIDADRDLFFRVPSSSDSGFLFTNDLAGLDAQGWDAKKIGYLRQSPLGWSDSTYEAGYSILHGINGGVSGKDVENTTANSTRSLHLSWIAIPFTQTQDNVDKIALSLGKTGTPASGEGDFRIVGDDGSSFPNTTDLRKQFKLSENRLQSIPVTPEFIELPFENTKVNSREELYLVVKIYGTSSNTFVAEYQTTTGTFFTSSDGVTWSSTTGDFKIRTYASNEVYVTLENNVSKKNFGVREKVILFPQNIQKETMIDALTSISEIIGKEKRIYQQVIVSPVTSRIPLGSVCRVQDSFNSLDFTAEIIGIDISMRAGDKTNVGADEIILSLQEMHY